jgi:FHA domain
MDAVLSGPTGRIVLGTTLLKIGRLPENQLVVNDVKASPLHAEIRPAAMGHILVDLGSTNGTFVNEQRLVPQTPRTLKVGDVLRIGNTNYTYESQDQVGIPRTVYGGEVGTLHDEPEYAPTMMTPGQEFPEYQAFSPIYAPPSQQAYTPTQQVPAPPPTPDYVPPQPGFFPTYQPASGEPVLKKKDRKLWINLGVIAGVLVLLILACAVLLFVNAPTANKTLDAFCTNIKHEDGQAASRLFSDDFLKSQADGVTSFVTVVDSGQIPNCTHTPATTSDQSAQAQLVLTTNDGSIQKDNVRLTTDSNGNWKIADLQIAQ